MKLLSIDRIKPEYRFDMYKDIKLIPNKFVTISQFYFKEVGYYIFRIIAKSPVDERAESIMLNVLDAPCFPPTVIFLFLSIEFSQQPAP